MDGTSRTTLHNTGLQWPNGLTLDLASQTLYWVDAGFDRIESSNSNGTNRRVLTTSYIFHPFGIDIFRGRLYWTDWQTNAVLSASVAQPTSVGVVISNLIFDPMGVKVISTEKQPAGMLSNARTISDFMPSYSKNQCAYSSGLVRFTVGTMNVTECCVLGSKVAHIYRYILLLMIGCNSTISLLLTSLLGVQ